MVTILVVDDHADIRKLVRMSLEFDGYGVEEAAHADQALSQLQTLRPALIVSDVMMPGSMDGMAFCRHIKTTWTPPAPPVVLLTGKTQDEDRELAMAAGADAFLIKPFSPLRLLQVVKDLLADRSPSDHANHQI